jgi:hypothetical protein
MVHDSGDSLELVLGERLGDKFDEELRKGTKFIVNRPQDLVAIIENL